MSEQTLGDAEKIYIEAEELALRLNLRFVGNEFVAEEEMEDDWVRLIDIAPIITQLEAKLEEHDAYYRKVVNDECAPDEKHCTCVPALRKENEALTGQIEHIKAWIQQPDGGQTKRQLANAIIRMCDDALLTGGG